MRSPSLFLISTAAAFGAVTFAAAAPKPAAKIDFQRDIRPILSVQCYPCHGSDESARQAGLRLDLRDAALAKKAILPGKPEQSAVMTRIAAKDPAMRMPPPKSGHSLMPREVGLIRQWIAEGAPYAEHWAFKKPELPKLPAVKNRAWVRNPVDAFVLARLEAAGLKPAPEADRYTLIRRVSLDLTGIPPTPAEVEAFVNDKAPDAYERLVDRLLASPQYGERWARMWLDLARYADSAGYGSDPLRPNIWPYRDYVINAFNKNTPYDRFTIEQLAGDLLPKPTTEQLVATAFHRNTMTNTEGGTDREEFRTAAVKDRIATTAQVWMGLTLGCAQCHSHKFDPITQREYYQFYALFNQTEDADRPDEQPTLSLPTPEQQAKLAALHTEIADVTAKVKAGGAEVEALKKTLAAKQKELAAIKPVDVPVMRELPAGKHRVSHLLIKGNFLNPGDEVKAAFPAAFPAPPKDAPLNRLGVAEWLVSRENPLTARVAVNRFWAQLFGTGIVETEEDFGTQGALPTHPELLDWMAVTFREGVGRWVLGVGKESTNARPWDVKGFLKLLVTSATYRQSCAVSAEAVHKDPRNRLLSHYPRRRLDAEGVRDQALEISGLLSHKIGGPSVYPPQPDGLWQAAFNGQRTWPTSKGEDRYRRGIYTFWRRTIPYPSMATFDAPSRENCTLRRLPTNTPLQALVTLNDPAYVEMAQALGRRIVKEGGTTAVERARYALRLALCRPPSESQVTALVGLYEKELSRYTANAAGAKKLATEPLGPLPDGMQPAEGAAWTVVANVLLNLDGVLTRS